MTTDQNRTKITILTANYRIKGYIDVLPGARVTDFVVESKNFIVVTDAEVFDTELGGRLVLAASFIDINRQHIQILAPA